MSKRDYIDEILEKKRRSKNDWQWGSWKLLDLERSFSKFQEDETYIKSHYSLFLVGIVTCLEVATRQAIQRLVDEGSPYIERIDKFKDFLRIDLNITKALHDKKISFGELVSHLLPVNNLENIISHLGVLLNSSFAETLKNLRHFEEPDLSQYFEDEINDEIENEESELQYLIIDDVNSLFATLTQIFTNRHIIVHEGDFDVVSTKEELENYFSVANTFIRALEELIEQLLNPNMSRNALGISLFEAEEAGKVYEEMDGKYTELYGLTSDEQTFYDSDVSVRKQLKITQDKFLEYMEAETAFIEALIKPMSGNTLRSIDSQVQKEFCEHRIKVLDEHLKWVKEDF